jgi:hypothetical protein
MKRRKGTVKDQGNKDPAHRRGSQRQAAIHVDFVTPQPAPLGEELRDVPVDDEFQDEPMEVEESRNGGGDQISTPLLSARRTCHGCNSFAAVPETTDLLDDINVGDELEEIGPCLMDKGTTDESVPLYKASILHIGLFRRRNFLLGRNSRGLPRPHIRI